MYYPVGFCRHIRSVREAIGDPDIVHSFVAHPYLPAAALSLIGRDATLTATALGTYAVQPLVRYRSKYLLEYGYRQADAVFPISAFTEREILSRVPVDNSTMLPLGVDLDRFGDADPVDDGYVLSVGAVKGRKAQEVLVEAFARIAGDVPAIDLKIAGPVQSPDIEQSIRTTIAEYGIGDRVELLGNVSDQDRLADLYRRCTLFALTPRVIGTYAFEGFGLVYLEAAAYGKPAVATRSGGVPTAVRDGETGLLADEDDVDGIATALRTLLVDDERREAYGRNARARAESLTWERYVKALEASWGVVSGTERAPGKVSQ
jgi:phosphatidylinositol alpha-1,6-mannosyltransferase